MSNGEGSPRTPREPASRHQGRGVPLGGIILVAIGVLLLLQTTGAVPWDVWAELWRFWPVVLIAIGVNIVLGKRYPAVAGAVVLVLLVGVVAGAAVIAAGGGEGTVTSSFQAPLEETKEVDVSIGFGAGTLTLRSLSADSPLLVDGQFETPGREASVVLERAGSEADLHFDMETEGFRFGNAGWDIAFSQAPDLSLDVDVGATDADFDLRQLQVSRLALTGGAASATVHLPEQAGETEVVVESGASSIDLRVPEGVAARITSSSGLSAIDVDESRFPETDDGWRSPDYDTAQHRVAVDLRTGVASVDIR